MIIDFMPQWHNVWWNLPQDDIGELKTVISHW